MRQWCGAFARRVAGRNMHWQRLGEPWEWLFTQLSNPDVLKASAFVVAVCAAIYLAFRLVRWPLTRHLKDAVGHLLDEYDRRYRFQGIARPSLLLIARCAAWVFALKLISEVAQPFVERFLWTDTPAQILGVARYDWLVLGSLATIILLFWLRFYIDVRRYDATRPDPSGIRTRWRTVPLFAKPTGALLLLMFLPDLCRFGATIGTTWARAALPDLATAQASANEPLGRNFAGDLRVTLSPVPRERMPIGARDFKDEPQRVTIPTAGYLLCSLNQF